MSFDYIRDPAEIYRQSFATIRAEAKLSSLPDDVAEVAVRLIHACGMVDIVDDLAFSPDAAKAGRSALQNGAPVLCDARMVSEGIIRKRLPMQNEIMCWINEPESDTLAKKLGTTRSAAVLEFWKPYLAGSVVCIGNAPTSLFRLLELLEEGVEPPAVILGFPVGFVGAAESKDALIEQCRNTVPFMTIRKRRGGSAMAAAAVNALAKNNE